MYVDKEPRKKHLISQLNPIKSQWYSIGEQLEVQDGDLKTIQLNPLFSNDSIKLSEVFQKWSDGRTIEVSWRTILDVIRSPPISNFKVFYDVQKFLSRPEIQHLYLLPETMVVPPVASKPTKPPLVATKPTKPPPVATKPTKPPPVATKPTKPPLVATKPTKPPLVATKPPSVATKPTKPPLVATKPTKPPLVATKPPSVATKPTKPPLVATKPKRGSKTDLIESKTSLSKIKVRNMLN